MNDGLKTEQMWVSGLHADYVSGAALVINAITANATTVNGATVSGATHKATTSTAGQYTANTANQGYVISAGSPYGQGVILPMTARAVISGGQFVSASGNLAYPAAASSKWPIGMAVPGTNVASGGTVNVITHGIVPAIGEGTIAVGAPAMMGAGAGLNCIVAVTAASGVRTFGVLDAVGSEATAFIVL